MKASLIAANSAIILLIAAFCVWAFPKKITLPRDPLPDFLSAQIADNLANVHIRKSDITSTWDQVRNNTSFVRYKLINGHLSVSANSAIKNDRRYIIVTESLQRIFRSCSMPDLDFIVCLEDSIDLNIFPCPIFTFATKGRTDNLILMPDPTALDPKDRAYITTTILNEGKKRCDWSCKKNVVFWRGSPTGPAPSEAEILADYWVNAPRFCLVKLSKQHPDQLDAGFITKFCENKAIPSWPYTTIGIVNGHLLASKFELVEAVHPKNHLVFKYLIDIDGNSCCYSRTYWILLSNSLMLKQVTDNRQWFYNGIQPYVHYVPIQENLSDLFEKIEWCKSNDLLARKIAENGTEFALKHLQYENNLHFLKELLKAYAAHMEFSPIIEKDDATDSIVPYYGKIYHLIKGFLRKKMNKPIAVVENRTRGNNLRTHSNLHSSQVINLS